MHEVSVMTGIVEAVLQELEKHDVRLVEEVVLAIGELTRLGEDQMTFAYDIITKGTLLEGSKLVIEEEPIDVLCESCGYRGGVEHIDNEEFHNSIPVLSCPECEGSVKIMAGKTCTVRSLKVVEN